MSTGDTGKRGAPAPAAGVLRERPTRVLAVLPTYDALGASGKSAYVRRVVEQLAARDPTP